MVTRVPGISVLAQQLLFAREVHPGEVLEEAEYPRKHLRALSGGDALMEPIGRVEKLLVALVDLGNARRVLRTPAKDGARDQRRIEDVLHAPLVDLKELPAHDGVMSQNTARDAEDHCRHGPPDGEEPRGAVQDSGLSVELTWPKRLEHILTQEQLHLALPD